MISNNPELKKMVFKLWDSLGPSYKMTKYLSVEFDSLKDYYLTLAGYFGVDGIDGLVEYIKNDINEFLSDPENNVCPEGEVKMVDLDLSSQMDSRSNMNNLYRGFGSRPSVFFEYFLNDVEGFQCPEEAMEPMWNPIEAGMEMFDTDNPDDPRVKEFCFEDYCARLIITEATRIIHKKYGINCGSVNISSPTNEL